MNFAKRIEQAGADAIELKITEVVTEPTGPGLRSIEAGLRQVVDDLKRELRIPVAVKSSLVLYRTCQCRARTGTGGCAGLSPVQSVSSAGYRYPPFGRLATP